MNILQNPLERNHCNQFTFYRSINDWVVADAKIALQSTEQWRVRNLHQSVCLRIDVGIQILLQSGKSVVFTRTWIEPFIKRIIR